MRKELHLNTLLTSAWGQWAAAALAAFFIILTTVNVIRIVHHGIWGVAVQPVSEVSTTKRDEASNLEAILQWHIFGEQPKEDLDAKTLPKSLLNISIVGLFAATPEKDASVVIATADGQENVYRVGDELSDGVIIYKILKDSVILQRGARYEVLELPDEKLIFEPAPKPLNVNQP